MKGVSNVRIRLHQFVAVLALFSAVPAFAQSQAINGTIRGRVVDPAGAPIAAASVKIDSAGTGLSKTEQTGDEGYYLFANLPLGAYTVTVQKDGFETQRFTGVVLDAGSEASINAQLKVGSVSTSVEVSGGAPMVDPSRVSQRTSES
jgi:hypothetical protein